MNKGKIICLNGVSSSGKSTLAKALQDKLKEPYYLMSEDTFTFMLPEKFNGFTNDTNKIHLLTMFISLAGIVTTIVGIVISAISENAISLNSIWIATGVSEIIFFILFFALLLQSIKSYISLSFSHSGA